jgi:NAD(P)-dependent dehydrogenase (short-subunit alcohol dehydrogenase family)
MSRIDASQLLRGGLLEDVFVLLVGGHAAPASAASPGALVHAACAQLGAGVSAPAALCADRVLAAAEGAIEEALDGLLAQGAGVDLLVVDGAALFSGELASARAQASTGAEGGAGAQGGARQALRGSLQASWKLTRAVVNRAYLGRGRRGRILYIAPAPDAGEHAEPARAALENLARTLSIEWARHGITVVAIAPGSATPASEVAALTAYLASPAGAYFSGCLLDLRGLAARAARPPGAGS